MEIKDYQEIIKKTAVFPSTVDNFGIAYAMLGLDGEFGEVLEELDQRLINKKNLTKESGDCCWYLTALSNELKLDIEEVFNFESNELTLHTQVYIIKFQATKAILSEKVKKFYRDGKELDKIEMTTLLNNMAFCIYGLIRANNIEFSEVLQKNYDKLIKRRETNTLHGEGSNREE